MRLEQTETEANRCSVADEIVFTIECPTIDERKAFVERLAEFLRNQPASIKTSEPEVITGRVIAEPTAEEKEELAMNFNWVLSCKVPPSTEDEF